MGSDWTHCVLDASMGCGDGLFTFCPIELDEAGEIAAVVDGMNWVSADPPARLKLYAIIHPDGQEAVDAFCVEFATELDALRERRKAAGQ